MGDGNDRLLGGARGETVMDGNGADTVSLGGGNDLYQGIGANGSDGSDTVAGGSGTDLYDASLASKAVLINLDTVAHDVSPLVVGAFRVAAGRALGIELAGATANDLISGFEDADGGQGDDVIYGSGAANVLQGLSGHDTLMGYGSSDRLDGGDGNDTLVGGAEQDRLSGGAGADIFSFVKASDSGNTSATRDVIRDFQDGFDRIDLRFVDAKAGTAADEAFAFIGTNVAWGGQAGQLRAVWTSGGQIVQGDTNGDRITDFAVMVRDASLSVEFGAADFLL
jgi:Ca2+-binding RTX toxin-like protein